VGAIQYRGHLGDKEIRTGLNNNRVEELAEAISSQNMMNKLRNFITSIRKIMKL
jgi:hypothetical protein